MAETTVRLHAAGSLKSDVQLGRSEAPALAIVPLPPQLSVGADYGLTVMDGASQEAWALALHILSPTSRAILAKHGFDAPGITE
jgi:ABC-type molybdate transport system substrate-binding protein